MKNVLFQHLTIPLDIVLPYNKKSFALDLNETPVLGAFRLTKINLHKDGTTFPYDPFMIDTIITMCTSNAHKPEELSKEEKVIFDLIRSPDILLKTERWILDEKEIVAYTFKNNFISSFNFSPEFCHIPLKNLKSLTREQRIYLPADLKVDFEFTNDIKAKEK